MRLWVWGVSFSLFSIFAEAQLIETRPSFAPGVLLVAPRDGVSDSDLGGVYRAHGGNLKRVLNRTRVHVISVPANAIDAVESALRRNPKIKYVEKDAYGKPALTPTDPKYGYQWHHPKMGSPSAWDLTLGSSSVPVAILDTGFDVNNLDISSKFLPGYNASTGTSDYKGNSACSSWSHGTAVASASAAAGNNGVGTVGVAWGSPIIPVSVYDSGCNLPLSSASAGVIWAADHGAKVINMSFIFYWAPPPQTFIDAIKYALGKGVVVVAAAGNESADCAKGTYPCYPQSVPGVIAVAATNSSDVSTSFTNFGAYVAVSAPGEAVYTSGVGGALWSCVGTSFSSPIVAGAAALMLSVQPGLTSAQVLSILKSTADDLGPSGWDPYYGAGRVNIGRAVATAALTNPDVPPPPPPVDTTAPTLPQNLIGSISTSTSGRGKKQKTSFAANLSWSASTDDVGVVSYSIYRNGVKLATASALSYADKALTKGTTYTYSVRATDAAGNTSAASNSISLTP